MRSAFSPLARGAVPPRDSIPPKPRSLAAPQLLLLLGAGLCPARVLPAVGHACPRPKLRDLGSVPGKTLTNAGRVPVTPRQPPGRARGREEAVRAEPGLPRSMPVAVGPKGLPLGASGNERKRHRGEAVRGAFRAVWFRPLV